MRRNDGLDFGPLRSKPFVHASETRYGAPIVAGTIPSGFPSGGICDQEFDSSRLGRVCDSHGGGIRGAG